MSEERFNRVPNVLGRFEVGRSTLYGWIGQGLFPRGVSLGARLIGWPEREVSAVIAARIRGVSDEELRALVSDLEAARKAAA